MKEFVTLKGTGVATVEGTVTYANKTNASNNLAKAIADYLCSINTYLSEYCECGNGKVLSIEGSEIKIGFYPYSPAYMHICIGYAGDISTTVENTFAEVIYIDKTEISTTVVGNTGVSTMTVQVVKNQNTFMLLPETGTSIRAGILEDDKNNVCVGIFDSWYAQNGERRYFISFFNNSASLNYDKKILKIPASLAIANGGYRRYLERTIKHIYYIFSSSTLATNSVVEIDDKEYLVLGDQRLMCFTED